MTGKVRHLLDRDGRYFARLVVPPTLRPYLDGKTELRTPLGAERRQALAKLPGAVAALQHRIGVAEQQAAAMERQVISGRYPLNANQIAARNYHDLLDFDEEIRTSDTGPVYSNLDPEIHYADLASDLRAGMAGKLTDNQLEGLIGYRIDQFRHRGNVEPDTVKGTPKWRDLAIKLCASEYEALCRIVERNEGDFTGKPSHPLIASAMDLIEETPVKVVTFKSIIDGEVSRRARGRNAKPLPDRTIKKYRDACKEFAKSCNSSNALTVTTLQGKQWLEAMQDSGLLSNRTVTQKFQNVVTVLNWGRQADPAEFHPLGNPLAGIKTPDWSSVPSYLRAYTMAEAATVLALARKETSPMLRWIPWLCAYSGMRVSEAGDLNKEDFFKVGDRWFWKVTTVGGKSLKTAGSERRIPVHKALVDEGLIEFVEAAPTGRLFRGKTKDDVEIQPRVSEWVREIITFEKRPELSPNHGWRHLFEDLCRRDRVQEEARNYMTGRTSGKSHELYGRSEVMLPGLALEMDQIKPIPVD